MSRLYERLMRNLRTVRRRRKNRRRPMVSQLTVAILMFTIMGGINTAPVFAGGGCGSANKNYLVRSIGGQCSDWKVIIRKTDGRFLGGKFNSNGRDTRLRGPRVGRIDTAVGRVWSTSSVTRRVTVTVTTYWRDGARTNLTNAALTPKQAANKYRTGDGSASCWSLIAGSENTGWSFDDCSARRIWVYHGHVDQQFGRTGTGNWTPEVPKAGAWYWNN